VELFLKKIMESIEEANQELSAMHNAELGFFIIDGKMTWSDYFSYWTLQDEIDFIIDSFL